eukprot:gene4959-5604_t
MEKREMVRKWATKDKSHPWVRTLQSNDPGVVRSLIHMAVDVYNDSKLLTQSTWSWPSRSLAQLHAEEQFKTYGELDATPSRFQPSPIDLHYRDPVHYAEMLHIVATLEKEKLKKDLQNCLRFSVQIDGSVDAKQHDKKFVFIRFNKKDDPLSILVRFISAKQVEKRGAEGLFEAVITSLEDLGITKEDMKSKFAGVTTDGESANTGRNSGLWARLEQYVEHPTFNFWCACHRSDLAMENVVQSVPELKVWKANVTALSTFYHCSGLRAKELGKNNPKIKSFPAHHDVRFAQHLIHLCRVVLHNLEACRMHWQQIVAEPSAEYDKSEKSSDMLRKTQKEDIIIPDVLRYRDIALQKLKLLENEPYPGGEEEKLEKFLEADNEDQYYERCPTAHSLSPATNTTATSRGTTVSAPTTTTLQ